ncbi:hypothetical protein LWC35_29330 [Pseudonocardia kujensis]|uniref:hypothetical protein n=1 Tax=Pseudonocardia kujensis TaxID=1128675 RepID=UPI001E519C3F|nr:hypothetical protein [Pseudonocardia kujensis]MCE0766979.1 hypothetical protein [Pseudonocardia kujensis]
MLVELGGVPTGETVATVLAQNPEPPPDKGEEFGKASPVALVVILCLAVATIVLIVSMSRRIRRLPQSFDEQSGQTEPAEQTGQDPDGADRDEAGTSAGERPEQR